MSDMKEHVEKMIEKASKADDAGEAMKFSQAAVNAANAMCALKAATQTK